MGGVNVADPTDPVYIGGLDRSGKTTMRAFLASHPSIAIPSVGSNMWTYFYRRFGDLAREENFERCLAAMLRYKHVRFLDPDPDRIRAEFAAGERSYARLFSLFLIHFAEREGKPRWGAQTGLIERYAPEMFDAYPGLKIVHMVRDPRDRYEASISKWPDGKLRAGGATARFNYSIGLAERHVRNHPDGYLLVRFEDLIRDTETTLRAVCDFLGEEYRTEMLEMPAAPKMRSFLLEGGGSAGSLLSEAFVGGHRGRIPAPELAFIQLHAGRGMRRHGYDTEPIPMDGRERLRFWVRDWPDQLARMIAWRAVEWGQQTVPRVVPRRFGTRMIVDPPPGER